MQIIIVLKHLFPNLKPIIDFEIVVDAEGNETISAWRASVPQPDEATLLSDWLPALKAFTVDRVKAIANEHIEAYFPDFRQRNYLHRTTKLIKKKVDGGTLTDEEIAELTAIENTWDKLDSIRTASDSIEADVNAFSTASEVENYDIGWDTNKKWPTLP